MIIVHSIAKPPAAEDSAGVASVVCRRLGPNEPIPQGAIWIDLVEPAMEEDQRVQEFVGAPVPTKADPDFTEPPESYYAENGVRYLHGSFVSEPEDTPDVTGVTFVSDADARWSPCATIPATRSSSSGRSSASQARRRCTPTRWRSASSTPSSTVPPGR